MAVTEREKLKLNVNNIKSVLLDGRKNQDKINKTKNRLVFKGIQKQKRLQAESNIEKKPESTGSKTKSIFGGIGNKITSIWDKVLNFFGTIVIGALVTKLPELIAGVENTFKKIRGVWDGIIGIFTAIGAALSKFVNAFSSIFGKNTSSEFKDLQKELDNLDQEISEEDASRLIDIEKQKESLENEGIFPGDSEWDHLDAKEDAILGKYMDGGDSTASPPNQPISIPKRKLGGGIENSEQPNQQPARSPESTTKDSPLKLFPKVAKESTKPIKVYSENIDRLSELMAQNLPGLGGGGGGTDAITAKAKTKSLGKRGKDIGNLLALPFRDRTTEVDPRSNFASGNVLNSSTTVSPVVNKIGDMKLADDSETTVITYIQPIEITKIVRTSTPSSGSSPTLPDLQSTKTEYIPIP